MVLHKILLQRRDVMNFSFDDVVALIPARGGSKAIQHKNLATIAGKSLLARAIEGVNSLLPSSSIFVSTDSADIEAHAQLYDVCVHNRSDANSTDNSTAVDVIDEFIRYLERHRSIDSTLILYLQPTSPFRNKNHIRAAINQFLRSKEDDATLISISTEDIIPNKMLLMENEQFIPFSSGEELFQNRQAASTLTKINGAIYIFRAKSFKKINCIPTKHILPFRMNKLESIDVDDGIDLKFARLAAKMDISWN